MGMPTSFLTVGAVNIRAKETIGLLPLVCVVVAGLFFDIDIEYLV